MSFSNENPDEADERRLRSVMRQAAMPESPSLGNLLSRRRRRRMKLAATLASIAAGIVLALSFHQYWLPPRIVCIEAPPVGASPFDPPPVDSLDLLTLDLSALESIGEEKPR